MMITRNANGRHRPPVPENANVESAVADAAPSGRFVPSRARSVAPTEVRDGLVQTLVRFGLSAHEARLYATLAVHGPATAREALQRARLDRATSYRVLGRLLARGLATNDSGWPRTYTAYGLRKLLDRMGVLLKDEVELLQLVHESHPMTGAAVELPHRSLSDLSPSIGPSIVAPTSGPLGGRTEFLADRDAVIQGLERSLRAAREEVVAVVRLRTVPPSHRTRLAEAFADVLARHVRVKLVLDHHPVDLRFLQNILDHRGSQGAELEARYFVPMCLHLYVLDRRRAIRFLGFSVPAYRGPEVGVDSEEGAFVRAQLYRFGSVWNESAIARTTAPPSNLPAPPAESFGLPASNLAGPSAPAFGSGANVGFPESARGAVPASRTGAPRS